MAPLRVALAGGALAATEANDGVEALATSDVDTDDTLLQLHKVSQ